MQRRLARLVGGSALVAVSVVLSHELVYLARYGSRYNEALIHGGHGESWTAAVTLSLLLVFGLGATALARLTWLGLLLRRSGAEQPRTAQAGALHGGSVVRSLLATAPRLVVLAAILLSLQENAERVLSGQAPPGPFVLLSPEYAGGLWITILTAIAVAIVASLFDWRRQALLARIRASRVPTPRLRATQPRRPAANERPAASLLGRRSALRAPPQLALS